MPKFHDRIGQPQQYTINIIQIKRITKQNRRFFELEGGKISNNVTGLKIWLKNRNQRHTRDWQVLRAGFHGNGIQ